MVRLTEHEELSRETVRRRLAVDDLKPWRWEMWCIPEVGGIYAPSPLTYTSLARIAVAKS